MLTLSITVEPIVWLQTTQDPWLEGLGENKGTKMVAGAGHTAEEAGRCRPSV